MILVVTALVLLFNVMNGVELTFSQLRKYHDYPRDIYDTMSYKASIVQLQCFLAIVIGVLSATIDCINTISRDQPTQSPHIGTGLLVCSVVSSGLDWIRYLRITFFICFF